MMQITSLQQDDLLQERLVMRLGRQSAVSTIKGDIKKKKKKTFLMGP